MNQLADKLSRRFEEEICRVCVLRTVSADCSLEPGRQCPVFRWAEELAPLVERISSASLTDYMDQVQAIVCPQCVQDELGGCRHRDDLDCPLDLYFALVVRVLEEEIEARQAGGGAV